MEIQIIGKQADMVQVRSPIGCFNGTWCSSTPVISKRYIVELDSADVINLAVIERSDSCSPHIEYLDQAINITGFVEEIQDKVMVLRLLNSLMMLEISSNSDFAQYIGHYVNVRMSEIRLYDTGIY